MKKLCFAAVVLGLLSACGAPRQPLMMNNPMNQMNMNRRVPYGAANVPMRSYQAGVTQAGVTQAGAVRTTLTPTRPKEESKLVERKVTVPRSALDDAADKARNSKPAADSLYKTAPTRSPFDSPTGTMPFSTFTDLRDHVRYGYGPVFEDYKYFNETQARAHFTRYINTAYREVQRLYNASRDDMKRFITVDTLVNSLSVEGRALSYLDVHNPPAASHYKLQPPQASQLMPTFGEIVGYNRSSMDVNYFRWDYDKAARYYQSNYSRIFALIMEYGPSKQDAWRLVHREISAYASY